MELITSDLPAIIPPPLPSKEHLATLIHCPYPTALNPNAEDAHVHSVEWVHASGLVTQPAMFRRLRDSRMGDMVSRFYPGGGREELRVAAEFVCWAFLLDDSGDESSLGKDPERWGRTLDRYAAVVDGAPLEPGDSPMSLALHEVRQKMLRLASPEGLRHFVEGCFDYFRGVLWEARNRAQDRTPAMLDFVPNRPAAGAVPPFVALIDTLERIELPPEVYDHPLVKQLRDAAGNAMCWINDLLSLDKELRHGDVHNLILVQQREHGLDLAEAVSRAVALTNDEMSKMLELEKRLPSFGQALDAELARYVRALWAMVRGTLDWTYESARYKAAA